MNKTLASLVIIAFLLCPLYTGCGPKNTELAEPLSDSSFPGSSFSVDSTTQPVAQGISGHISKDGFENVRFDADIVIPDDLTRLSIWNRDLLDINPDNVVMAFSPYFDLDYEQTQWMTVAILICFHRITIRPLCDHGGGLLFLKMSKQNCFGYYFIEIEPIPDITLTLSRKILTYPSFRAKMHAIW